MSCQEMKGEKISRDLLKSLKPDFESLKEDPYLAILFVGDDQAAASYIEEKKAICKKLGVKAEVFNFDANVSEEEILRKIEELNSDPSVNAILPQLPMQGVDSDKVFEKIDPLKDVDGLTPYNLGRLMRGRVRVMPGAVKAIFKIFNEYNVKVEGKDVVIVNNSNLIGKPLSLALTNRGATVTVCHDSTRDLRSHTSKSDIVITATGQPNLIGKEMVKKGAVVVDAGYAKEDGKIRGDVNFDEVKEKASKLTPNPGGVGPVTVAVTMQNLYYCYQLQQNKD